MLNQDSGRITRAGEKRAFEDKAGEKATEKGQGNKEEEGTLGGDPRREAAALERGGAPPILEGKGEEKQREDLVERLRLDSLETGL